MQADQPHSSPLQASQCASACPVCSRPSVSCKAGVSTQRDGCGCCFICTRQHGDLCDHVYTCDPNKNLYCDTTARIYGKGVCRAREARACRLHGHAYEDGQEFTLGCSQLCTCQDSYVTCTSTCSHENRRPSAMHCPDARLVSIEGKCCKEWACPLQHVGSIEYPHSKQAGEDSRECSRVTSPWTACSATCGVGESMRVSNNNERCETVNERRLCLVRPCSLDDTHLTGTSCRDTWRQDIPMRISYQECVSHKEYHPKYCSTCRRDKCCFPSDVKTIDMRFNCMGTEKTLLFAWNKACECSASQCP